MSDGTDADCLRSFATLDHVHGYSLPFRQRGEAAAVERRRVHEDVLAATVADDEAEPFIRVVPLHRADLLDGRLIRRSIRRPLRSRPPRLLLKRRGLINAQDLGYLHALLTRSRPNLERGAGRHGTVTATFDNADVEKGIATCRQ